MAHYIKILTAVISTIYNSKPQSKDKKSPLTGTLCLTARPQDGWVKQGRAKYVLQIVLDCNSDNPSRLATMSDGVGVQQYLKEDT